MIRSVTTSLSLLACFLLIGQATAQPMEVTIREINAIAQENVDALNAAGASLMTTDITPLVQSTLEGQEVVFTAVVLTDPRNSGLANVTEGLPNRIHIYVRDVSAATEGVEGMGIQIVDGAYATTGSGNLIIGDVIRVTGAPATFSGVGGNSLQINVTALELLGSYDDPLINLPESILDPVVITTADANKKIDEEGGIQVNWDNLASLNGQYVKVENATLLIRAFPGDGRPNWLITTDGGETVLSFYDVSLRYRNDKSNYPDDFNTLDDDFVPPTPGTLLNLTGTILYQGDDPFGRSVPDGALLSIAPWDDADLEILESPPILSIPPLSEVPDGTSDYVITFTTTVDPARTIASEFCTYWTSADPTENTIDAPGGSCSIPAQADGVFTYYTLGATDNTDATSESDTFQYRTLADGINEIADIQLTVDEGPGDSPFAGFEAASMDFTATVQSDPPVSGLIVLQDKEDLAPWSGITLFESETELQRGDIVQITQADISEFREATQLSNATYTVLSSGNDPLGYKVVTTNLLQDESVAEAHEGMMLQIDNVTIVTQNADSPDDPTGNNFGEWAISSDGTTENQLRVDDASAALPSDPDAFDGIPAGFNYETISPWGIYAFHRGVLSYSFGFYKLLPESPADIGELINVANEDEGLPDRFALHQNFPNPFNPTTSISYQIATSGYVTLQVFDLLGRQVRTLVDGMVNAGEHKVTFDAQGLPSGLYLYRLTAGAEVSTKKMILLK